MLESTEGISIGGWLIIIGFIVILSTLVGGVRRGLISQGLTPKQSLLTTTAVFLVVTYLIYTKTNIIDLFQNLITGGV